MRPIKAVQHRQPDHRDDLTEELRRYAAPAPRILSSSDGSVVMTEAAFAPFEGRARATPFLKIGLNLGARGRVTSISDATHIEGVWTRGAVMATPSGLETYSRSSQMHMLGLALQPHKLGMDKPGLAEPVLRNDPVIASVMTAMWHTAEDHGLSSAFFEHGAALILERLRDNTWATNPPAKSGTRLGAATLRRLLDLIEARLDGDLTVAEMARHAGLDTSTLSRAFAASTGHTPHAYLTFRRMEHAKTLLDRGQSVTEVAGAVGYGNPSKFASMFRRWTGCPPSQWTKRRL